MHLVDLHVPTSRWRLELNPDLWSLVATQAKCTAVSDLHHCATGAFDCKYLANILLLLHGVSKIGCHFYFCNNFGKCRPILIFFTVVFSGLLLRKVVLKPTTSPQLCCRTTLRNLNAQLYNFTTKLLNSIWCNNV